MSYFGLRVAKCTVSLLIEMSIALRSGYNLHVVTGIMRSANPKKIDRRSGMVYSLKFCLFALIALAACESLAGGSDMSVTQCARAVSGKISEWPVPTPKFARDPAIGPDGNVYFAVRAGDRIARFDPNSKLFREWDLPAGTQPQGMLVARDNKVIFGSAGDGVIGELDPSTGKVKLHKTPSIDGGPYTLVMDAEDNIWFTAKKAGKLSKFERSSGKITEYRIGDRPYALILDKGGNVWVTRKDADRIARFDRKTGEVTELLLEKGSQPRRVTMAPDGMLWVSLYGVGKLAKIDPTANRVVKEYELPGGPNAGPYAMNADAGGRIWVSELQTDNVIMLDPRSELIRVFKLPTKDTGVRNAAIDADGRYWYVGSHAGRLGVIE